MKRLVRVALAAAAAIGAGGGHAQTYPAKAVRIVAAYPAGGSVDIVARMVGQRLTETMGRTFVIDNRSGASGNIGTEHVAKSAPTAIRCSWAAPLRSRSGAKDFTQFIRDELALHQKIVKASAIRPE
ncbi:MAG: hypothetical protein ACXWC1_02145 [Burkholderiales bacterium]